jgi:predicted dienelactone hydrolase
VLIAGVVSPEKWDALHPCFTRGRIALAWVLGLLTFGMMTFGAPCQRSEAKGIEGTAVSLPEPDGRFAVGKVTLELHDRQRARDLLVTVWYPATKMRAAAPYMDSVTADALALEWQLKRHFERAIRTHAALGAAFADTDRHPMVLLEHGSGVIPEAYTVLAEGLASSGFVVVATNHPPDSLISVYPGGRVLKFTPYWPENADRLSQGRAIGQFAANVLAVDVQFVLDELHKMNASSEFWRGHFDLSKVGIVGHSMGGTTAAVAMSVDPRIAAGVNLDGSTFPGMNGDIHPMPVHKPFLFLATEEHAAEPVRAREFVGQKGDTYYVTVPGATHMAFTDAPLLKSAFAADLKLDQAAVAHGVQMATRIRGLVEQFFGKYLQGNAAPDLDIAMRVEKE